MQETETPKTESKISFIFFSSPSETKVLETRVNLPPGLRNLKQVVNVLNKTIKRYFSTENVFSISGLYVNYGGLVSKTQRGAGIRHFNFTLSEHLNGVLGFNSDDIFNEKLIESSRFHDFRAGFKYAIISCPIVENQFIGSDSIPILGIIPLDSGDNNMIYFEPRNLAYKKVVTKELSTIKVTVSNEAGSLLNYM